MPIKLWKKMIDRVCDNLLGVVHPLCVGAQLQMYLTYSLRKQFWDDSCYFLIDYDYEANESNSTLWFILLLLSSVVWIWSIEHELLHT